MRKNKIAILVLCIFILGIFTSACGGGGGKLTPPSYPFIPIPTPSPTISPTPEPTVSPTPAQYQLELSQTEFTVNIGETDNITVTLNGQDITQTATYTVDQEAIASVEQGLITGLSVGVATVTVHAENAIEDKTFTVNVIDPNLPTLEVEPTEVNLKVEKTSNVKVTLEGEDVTEKVNYNSDNESIATAEKGVVKAKDTEGTANIAVSLEGANSAIFKVNVKYNEVALNKDILALLGYEIVPNGSDHDIKKITDGEIVTNLEIPATFTLNGIKYKITSIGYQAFYECTSLSSITIPDSVTSIRYQAFYGCSSLENVTISDNVLCIFPSAFYNCNKLEKLNTTSGKSRNIPTEEVIATVENVTFIGVKLNNDVESLKAIEGEVTIPNGITEIPDGAFYNCSSLTSVKIPNTVTSIGGDAFCNCSSLTSVKIPNTVTSIGSDAFYNCSSLSSITIPDSVTNIEGMLFYGCSSLENVTISDNVLCIFPSTFYNCNKLEKLTTTSGKEIPIPTDVITTVADITFIGVKLDIFNNESMKSITGEVIIPDGVTKIPAMAFHTCRLLESIIIPDSVTSIGVDAFYYCISLKNVIIPDGVTSIGVRAFLDCWSLESITIPDSVTSIEEQAFFNCNSLTSVTILGSVTYIGEQAFSGCGSLTSVNIPDSVTYIGNGAFEGCGYYDDTAHLTLQIPSTVTIIGENAFYNVNNINISEAQKSLGGYPWGALHVNGEEP